MASLSLKNIPEELLDRIRALAGQNHRSLNREAIRLLEQAAQAPPASQDAESQARAEVDEQIRAWKALAGRWRSNQTVAEEIASIYGRRSRGRKADL